ncbi:hypothetical protein P153DRAFT_378684 [Dothidotthia symphoricarpi CBS 119687]|uniref:AB hydrolase-1 domain-containing protein n=1 Tax=Dothidotthia symphoricarpi CBS 119687 TaxID=1392245 RepID=A0A6A6A3Z7_9PLEO|nr:uncharacterized protein P153DRAFT_378684 [Dothidotthia symphoricarpi CBS 119687]KAF2125873.1 hypothetical protein P153DRAFT_378684 [Dothidotthia symphoricarpi CBS 119687]
MAMSSGDPRSSSTQSLVPDPSSNNAGRRRLLLVYIHGFMGNETSFRSFPAHVHNLVTITLAETHVVHTKLYPRYRSRNSLEIARDRFSQWLAPHEDQWTDVVLLGHSMGGLLAADITLAFRHRIIGVVNFDVPFLGMHPGIVKAGLGSIFSKPPAPEDVVSPESESGPRPSRMATIFNPKPADPNYNPAFPNDVNLPARKGWENALHWFNKHSDDLRGASKGLVRSHFEFGGAMADYRTLKDRYARVRALEEDDESTRSSANPGVRSPPRIRFVNYYTASTGRPKKPKTLKSPSSESPPAQSLGHIDSDMSAQTTEHRDSNASAHTTDRRDSNASVDTVESQPEMTHIAPEPMPESPRSSVQVDEHKKGEVVFIGPQRPPSAANPAGNQNLASGQDGPPDLPEVPPIPQEPPFVDLMQYTDKSQRRAAEKEHDQALKVYQKAVKARNRVINERTKMEEKWEKQQEQQAKEKEKERKKSLKQEPKLDQTPKADALEEDLGALQIAGQTPQEPISHTPYNTYDFSRSTIMDQAPPDDRSSIADSAYTNDSHASSASHQNLPDADGKPEKQKKLKKFCMLPPKDSAGNKDPTWIRVFMSGMDEVTAHTSLFFLNETYERLVGEVGAKIEDWVSEADSLRLVREMEGFS